MTDLPRALIIWNEMDYIARAEVMRAVGYDKSIIKWQRKCIAHIEARLAAEVAA